MGGAGPYGRRIAEHFRKPRNYGALPNATAEAEGSNPLCGDRVRVAIAMDQSGGRIEAARFTANACAICVASASLLTERLHGVSRSSAASLTEDDVLTLLGSEIPAARRRCALLPLEALRRALNLAGGPQSGRSVRRIPVVAVLLAAGSSRRFGGPQKLLSPVCNDTGEQVTLVRRSAIALRQSGLDRIVVVLGREGERVRDSLAGLDLRFVPNNDYAAGMSTSLRAGVHGAMDFWPEAPGILVALGDQPLTDPSIVTRLLHSFEASRASTIVAPRYAGIRGNPVIFGRELVDELLVVSGDQGAREVVEHEPDRVIYVDFDSPAPADVDTPEDLARLSREGKAQASER